jgi:hypothetical protein
MKLPRPSFEMSLPKDEQLFLFVRLCIFKYILWTYLETIISINYFTDHDPIKTYLRRPLIYVLRNGKILVHIVYLYSMCAHINITHH